MAALNDPTLQAGQGGAQWRHWAMYIVADEILEGFFLSYEALWRKLFVYMFEKQKKLV